MSFFRDISDAKSRFPQHIAGFQMLFKQRGISSISDLRRELGNQAFRQEFKAMALKVFEDDGGKVSLPILCVIVGAAMGGVGIAMAGSAFGLPLALLGLLGGVFVGSELDSAGVTKRAAKFFRPKR